MAPPLKKLFVFPLVILCVSVLTCMPVAAESIRKDVRVAILRRVPSVNLRVPGGYTLSDASSGRILFRGRDLYTAIGVGPSGILFAGKLYSVNKLLVVPAQSGFSVVNGRWFRGAVKIVREGQDKLLVVNILDIENYIKGILYNEVSHYWPHEALKAQAVVSRTYAVYQMQENRAKEFDVTADIYSQVYGGTASERFRTNEAVVETRGVILTSHGLAIPAYFHATCAGHTEDASLLWNINIPALKGVACPFCAGSPHFSWEYAIARKDLAAKLIAANFLITGIDNLTINGKDASGRVIDVEIVSSAKTVKIPGKSLRSIIGPNMLRSTNFTVRIAEDDVIFEGIGWGHGAGLCQWGAYFMAKDGKKYQEILAYYYPNTNVTARGF